jgi:hypothetical protein
MDLQDDHDHKWATAALRDPLSEVTRRERRLFLAVSTVCFAITKAGLVPTKISALGIDFSQADQKALLKILAAIVGYLLVAFVVYASADFLGWRIAVSQAIGTWWNQNRAEIEKQSTEENVSRLEMARKLGLDMRMSALPAGIGLAGPISLLRALIEFLFPVLFGIYCIRLLLNAGPTIGPLINE